MRVWGVIFSVEVAGAGLASAALAVCAREAPGCRQQYSCKPRPMMAMAAHSGPHLAKL